MTSSSAVAGSLLSDSRKRPQMTASRSAQTEPEAPVSIQAFGDAKEKPMVLELQDGSTYKAFSFGANKSISGELVFQTGMVGYPESVTDPSYRGQILVITFPLVGNYGVPSRGARDELLNELPAHFEATEIHIAGLVVASYSGEDFSHHLATSSLGTWLKEQNVPAIYGVDTRLLTKKIREQGSMLGKILRHKRHDGPTKMNGITGRSLESDTEGSGDWRKSYENIEWFDPNIRNLVADGEISLKLVRLCSDHFLSLMSRTLPVSSEGVSSFITSIW